MKLFTSVDRGPVTLQKPGRLDLAPDRPGPRPSADARPGRPSRRPGGEVFVIGGGPAGVAATLEDGEDCAAVTLVEEAAAIGGQLRLAGRPPAHRVLLRRWQA